MHRVPRSQTAVVQRPVPGVYVLTSWGSEHSSSIISRNGEYPVDSWTLVRYACMTNGSNSCQLSRRSFTNIDSIIKHVRLKRSTIPSDSGWLGAVRVLTQPSSEHSDFISPFSNSRPLSLWITNGIPNRKMILFTSTSATVSAHLSLMGNASVHLLK